MPMSDRRLSPEEVFAAMGGGMGDGQFGFATPITPAPGPRGVAPVAPQQNIQVNAPQVAPRAPAGAVLPSGGDDKELVRQAGLVGLAGAMDGFNWQTSPLQMLGRGIGGFLRGQYQGQQDLQDRKLKQAQFEGMNAERQMNMLKLSAAMEQQQRMQDMIAHLPPEERQMAMLNPEAYIKAKAEAKYKVQEAGSPEGKLAADLQAGRINQAQYASGMKRLAQEGKTSNVIQVAPPSVNIDSLTKSQTDAVQEYYGKSFGDWQQAGVKASQKIADLNQIESLLARVDTGKLTPASQAFKSTAKALGIDLAQLGIKDDVAPAEAAAALANKMALDARDPSSGAGMPGAMSDSDRQFLATIVPGLTQTAQGRKIMIDFQRKVLVRQQEVAGMARKYAQEHGKIDSGFMDQLQDFTEKNPLAPRMPTVKTPEEAAALEPGTLYMTPDGEAYTR